MKDYMVERIYKEACYVLMTQATLRATAKVFKVSKSTVHTDLTERLPKISPILASEVRKVIDKNLKERAFRGGQATKKKYEKMLDKNK